MTAEELIAILRQGESTRVEFKSDFPSQAHAIGKEMSALANSGGGILLMGVSDDGAPIGIQNADRAVERLAGIARSCSLSPEIDKFQISRNIFVVYVKIRPSPPCFYEAKIYHRVGSTSVECTNADQLHHILKSSPPPLGKRLTGTAAQRVPPHGNNWSGYWFVNVGEGAHRNWEDCRRYGFISAGQGAQYSRTLQVLKVGARIFAYVSRWGYVGYGEVTNESVPVRDFIVQSEGKPLLELPLLEENIAENSGNLELSEWLVGVKWLRTFSRSQAKNLKGVPSYRNIVCRLTHSSTIEFLEREFAVAQIRGKPTKTTTDRQPLSRQDEQSFLRATREAASSATAEIAEKLLEWSNTVFSDINWGKASFTPVLEYGSDYTFNPMTFYKDGKVEIQFQRMSKKTKPFDREEKRIEVLRRLNEIPGIRLPRNAINKFPKFPCGPLGDDGSLDQFKSVIQWMLDEVRAAN